MYQQQVPQPRDENSWSGTSPEYEAGYAGNLQQSDQLADAIARRLQAQAPSNIQTPAGIQFSRPPSMVTAGMRLALAIVSVVALIPLAGIALGILGGTGLIALGIVGAVILFINIAFNVNSHH
jgi:hypothetical protein